MVVSQSIQKRGRSEFLYQCAGKLLVRSRRSGGITEKWRDHGEVEGSRSVVDFAIKYLQPSGKQANVSNALDWLKALGFGNVRTRPLFSTEPKGDTISQKQIPKDLGFIRAKPVRHPAIFQYLRNRGIPNYLISKYLVEVRYRNLKKDKVNFGFGLKNRAGVNEVRSASDKPTFKSALTERDISIIKGSGQRHSVNIFEGMTDFLSLLVLLKTDTLVGDCIIMHPLSSQNQTLALLHDKAYKAINLWLDNDKAGRKTAEKFKIKLPDHVFDQSARYFRALVT